MEYPREPPPPYSPTAPPFPGVHQDVKSGQQPPGPPPTTIYGHPSYGATQAADTIIIQPPSVVIVGACPVCQVGVLENDFTCLGLLCAILFFPAGILCCLLLKEKKCSNCGATFG